MRDAIREVDPDRPIALGIDAETFFRSTGIDARAAIADCEFTVSHVTSAYRAYAAEGPATSGPSTYLDSFLLRLADRGKPVLADDVGPLLARQLAGRGGRGAADRAVVGAGQPRIGRAGAPLPGLRDRAPRAVLPRSVRDARRCGGPVRRRRSRRSKRRADSSDRCPAPTCAASSRPPSAPPSSFLPSATSRSRTSPGSSIRAPVCRRSSARSRRTCRSRSPRRPPTSPATRFSSCRARFALPRRPGCGWPRSSSKADRWCSPTAEVTRTRRCGGSVRRRVAR